MVIFLHIMGIFLLVKFLSRSFSGLPFLPLSLSGLYCCQGSMLIWFSNFQLFSNKSDPEDYHWIDRPRKIAEKTRALFFYCYNINIIYVGNLFWIYLGALTTFTVAFTLWKQTQKKPSHVQLWHSKCCNVWWKVLPHMHSPSKFQK